MTDNSLKPYWLKTFLPSITLCHSKCLQESWQVKVHKLRIVNWRFKQVLPAELSSPLNFLLKLFVIFVQFISICCQTEWLVTWQWNVSQNSMVMSNCKTFTSTSWHVFSWLHRYFLSCRWSDICVQQVGSIVVVIVVIVVYSIVVV